MISLCKDRVCHALLTNGTLGANGELPPCIGERCNLWEVCNAQILQAQSDIDFLLTHPSRSRIEKKEKWGEHK